MTSKIYNSTYDKNKTLNGEAASRYKKSLTFQKIKKNNCKHNNMVAQRTLEKRG